MPALKLENSLDSQRDRTRILQRQLSQTTQVSAKEALDALNTEWELFSTRLIRYVADNSPFYEAGKDEAAAARSALRKGAEARGFSFSGGDYFNRWLKDEKTNVSREKRTADSNVKGARRKIIKHIVNWQCYLAKETIFQLCLCLQLDISKSQGFVYDCLYLDWFDLRNRDDAIYLFVISQQELFGSDSFPAAKRIREAAEKQVQQTDTLSIEEDFTGATSAVLGKAFSELATTDYESDRTKAESEILRFLLNHDALFTQARRTTIARYNEYLLGDESDTNFSPLKEMYESRLESFTGRRASFPATLYLTMFNRDTGPYKLNEERLLWGSIGRHDWNEKQARTREAEKRKDIWEDHEDILNGKVIALDYKLVGSFLKPQNRREYVKGRTTNETRTPPRGNMLMLYFFHFCYKNIDSFDSGKNEDHRKLFEQFFEQTNYYLDDCGMMPLHPRRPFDALIMRSIANVSDENELAPYHPEQPTPIRFLNTMLMEYYALE